MVSILGFDPKDLGSMPSLSAKTLTAILNICFGNT